MERTPATVYSDKWSATEQVCNWERFWDQYAWASDPSLDWAWVDSPPPVPLYPSRECVDRVLQDFGADLDAFETAEQPGQLVGGADVFLEETTYPALHLHTRLAALLLGARSLFLFDYGGVERLRTTPGISEEFVALMWRVSIDTGQRELGAVAYNFITSTVKETDPGFESKLASFNPLSGVLEIHSSMYPGAIRAAGVMMHEARHATGPPHVACVGESPVQNADDACDTDSSGSCGFAGALGIALYNSIAEPGAISAMVAEPALQELGKVNLFRAPDGTSILSEEELQDLW